MCLGGLSSARSTRPNIATFMPIDAARVNTAAIRIRGRVRSSRQTSTASHQKRSSIDLGVYSVGREPKFHENGLAAVIMRAMRSIRLRQRSVISALVLMIAAYGASAGQTPSGKVLGVEDYTKWRTIADSSISGDGKWVTHTLQQTNTT